MAVNYFIVVVLSSLLIKQEYIVLQYLGEELTSMCGGLAVGYASGLGLWQFAEK